MKTPKEIIPQGLILFRKEWLTLIYPSHPELF